MTSLTGNPYAVLRIFVFRKLVKQKKKIRLHVLRMKEEEIGMGAPLILHSSNEVLGQQNDN